ncbi:SCO family protein [Lysobacter koreensis]|uniref:SCO family protein n=1 Tax=Lysobacter koreensis TaxID=266122 RepID=A0ABW2YHK6_9GAMM
MTLIAPTTLALATALLCAGALAAPPEHAAPAAAKSSRAGSAAALPTDSVYQLSLPLTDQTGRPFDWRARRGTPQVVTMFYTSCQYICPLIVDSGKAIEKQLTPAERARVGLLLVSMDPQRDTPQALAKVAAQRKLDPRHWTLARPAPGDVRAVAGVLGIRYRALADGEFNHTSALVLLDRDGRILARTEQVGSKPDPAFVAAVRQAAAP